MNGQTILIVDDEVGQVNLLGRILEMGNFRILKALRGDEALDVLERERADVVITDFMLGGKMNGILKQHGAMIEVSNSITGGARFLLKFPL